MQLRMGRPGPRTVGAERQLDTPRRRLRQRESLALLHGLPTAILDAVGLDDVLRVIARHVMEALHYEDCVIYVRDAPGTLTQAAAWGPKSPDGETILAPLRLVFGQGVVGSAASEGAIQLVSDTATDPRYVDDIGGGRSELAVPIVYRGEVLGVIDSEHPDVDFYDEDDANLIMAIAAIAAAQLHAAFSSAELRTTIAELEQAQARLERLANTDPVTGIANRHLFEAHLDAMVLDGERVAVCAMDLDGFKTINDVFGHHEGDKVLRLVAKELARTLTPAAVIVARVGGDEFTALAGAATPNFLESCANAVAQIDEMLADRYTQVSVTLSAGLAFGSSERAWLDADDAMYVAKRAGGNRLREFVTGDAGQPTR